MSQIQKQTNKIIKTLANLFNFKKKHVDKYTELGWKVEHSTLMEKFTLTGGHDEC